MPRSLIIFLCGFFILVGATKAFGFPELIRHGYSQCIACHVSPTGGGTLTNYGRALSEEVLSQWALPEESQFLYGVVKPPKWLNFGGDVRSVQLYRNNPVLEESKFILMQSDLEAAASLGSKWTLNVSAGFAGSPPTPISRRHYLMYKVTDEVTVRAGRFFKAYGINTADHAIETKRGLGWNEGTETYNIEGSWLLEDYDLFATLDLGRPDRPELQREKGIALRGSRNIGETYKVGMSYFYGGNAIQTRHLFGPWGLAGFSKHLFFLWELDFQRASPVDGSASRFGAVGYSRLGYELVRALNLFATFEFSKLDFSDPATPRTTWGGGIQFFPRPHLEVALFLSKQFADPTFGNSELGWLLLHYYL